MSMMRRLLVLCVVATLCYSALWAVHTKAGDATVTAERDAQKRDYPPWSNSQKTLGELLNAGKAKLGAMAQAFDIQNPIAEDGAEDVQRQDDGEQDLEIKDIRDATAEMESKDKNAQGGETEGDNLGPMNSKLITAKDLGFPDLQYLENYRNPCWYMNASKYNMEFKNSMCWSSACRKDYKRLKRMAERNGDGSVLRCLPAFFIVGPQKCGTTDLWQKLLYHPLLVSGVMKEPHFWAWKFPHGASLNQYADLYIPAAETIDNTTSPDDADPSSPFTFHPAITGDGSATTIWNNWEWDKTHPGDTSLPAHRIHALIPQAKIIVIIRDPIKRLVSDFLYFGKKNKTAEDRVNFEKMVLEGVEWMTDCYARHNRSYCIYTRQKGWSSYGWDWTPPVRVRLGLYGEFLEDWMATFPGQVHVELLDDYSADKLPVLNRIYNFLGVGDLPPPAVEKLLTVNKVSNIVPKKTYDSFGEVSEHIIDALHKFYDPFNSKLAQRLNRSLPWKCRYAEC